MPNHLVHDHRHGALVTVDAHPQAVADKEHVQAGGLGKGGRRKIVGGQEGDLVLVTFHLLEVVDHFLAGHGLLLWRSAFR